MKSFLRVFISFLVILIFQGCGGDSSSGQSSSSSPSNTSGSGTKGPFEIGSKVTAYKLNKDGSLDQTNYKTKNTIDNKGDFDFGDSIIWSGPTEFTIKGKYLNENTGNYTSSNYTLKAIVDLKSDTNNTININIFTNIAAKGIKDEMLKGNSFDNAKQMMQDRVRSLFELSNTVSLEELNPIDGIKNQVDNTKLLYVSAALLKKVTSTNSDIHTALDDISDKLMINNQASKDDIKNYVKNQTIDIGVIHANLSSINSNLPSENLTNYLSIQAKDNPVPAYTLTYTAGVHGHIIGTTTQTANKGSNGSAVTAVADSGYHFVKWSDNKTDNPRIDSNVQSNITVSALFAQNMVLIDTVKPIITLIGDANITLIVGDTYTDAGATAMDNRDGNITADIITTSSVDIMTAGTYAITYDVDDAAGNHADTVTRTVIVNEAVVTHDFAAFGNLKVLRYPDVGLSDDHYVVYYPKNAITPDMPVVIFLEGGGENPHIDDYRGIMEFMASQGYFVIGAEQGGSYNTSYGAEIVQKAIDVAIEHHKLMMNKIAVMGHSQGGGQAFYIMKYLQDKGYGGEGSLTLSLDGWFAFGMDQADLHTLKGEVDFIQMNGREGTGTDPRIKLTIWNLAKQTKRRFFTLPENEHGYIAGDKENIGTKDDIRLLIGALTHDVFEGGNGGYDAIPAENITTYDAIKHALKKKDQYHGGDCQGTQYNARRGMLHLNDIGYCNFEAVYPNTIAITPRAIDDTVARPVAGESVEDPVFGTTISRIDKSDNEISNYPKVQSWNSDATLLRIGSRLYNAKTLKETDYTKGLTGAEAYAALCSRNSDYFRWSTIEPDTFYVLSSSKKFIKGKINENSISCTDELASFDAYDVVHIGPDEGNIDFQDRYVLFSLKKPNDTAIYLMLYDIQKRTNVWDAPKVLPENSWEQRQDGTWQPSQMDWISVSPSGRHIVINERDKENYQKGLRVYDINFSDEHILKYDYNGNTYSEGGHGDMGYDAQGNEVVVEFLSGLPVHMFYLDQPDVLGKAMLPSALGGGHVGCRNYKRPGWCYVTTHQEDYRQIFALKLDADPQYKVQSFSQSHIHDNYPETYGAASPDGSQIIFNSNWDNAGMEADTYIVKAKATIVE